MNRLRHILTRWLLAWRYATDTMTKADAQWIAYDCDNVAGCWALECLGVDGLLDVAAERWSNPQEEIEPLIYAAARRIANKWECTGSQSAVAEEWALDLVEEFAEQEGIKLEEIDSE